MSIEKLIAGLPERSNGQISKMRARAVHDRRSKPADDELLRLVEEIDSEFLRRLEPPENGWTSGTQGDPRFLMHEGQRVGAVQRMETHRSSNAGVYVAEILGKVLPKRYRHVEDARNAVAAAFEQQGQT